MAANKASRWSKENYKDAIRSLRDDKRFIGFDAKDGYNLSNLDKLSARRKREVKEAIKTRAYLDMREQSDTVVYFRAPSKTAKKEIVKTLGFQTEGINTKHLSAIPLTKPAHIPEKDIIIRWDKTAKTVTTQYKRGELKNVRVPIDYAAIFSRIDFEMEEEEITDAFSIELSRQLYGKLADYNDGKSFFRASTFAGDLAGGQWGVYQSLDDLIEEITQIAEMYFDPNKKNGGIMVTSVSVYRDTSSRDQTEKQMKITASDRPEPKRKKWGRNKK